MRDYTNLSWPEAPFGSDQRPFGRRWDMLAALGIGWAMSSDRGHVPASVATVYLRIRRLRHGAYDVREDTLSIGFRTTMIDDLRESDTLVKLLDRALTRARRHAAILAGHNLGKELERVVKGSSTPLRGATGVRAAWADRGDHEGGIALMIDTGVEASAVAREVGIGCRCIVPAEHLASPSLAEDTLAQAVAIGMAAAAYTGRYRWEGAFNVREAIDRVGWDILPGAQRQPGAVGGEVG